jgi:hypothetical protein
VAQEDFPYCAYCDSSFRRFHVAVLDSNEFFVDMEFTCYDCGESVVVRYPIEMESYFDA